MRSSTTLGSSALILPAKFCVSFIDLIAAFVAAALSGENVTAGNSLLADGTIGVVTHLTPGMPTFGIPVFAVVIGTGFI